MSVSKRRLEALLAMAERGTEHERSVAQSLLDKYGGPLSSKREELPEEFVCDDMYDELLFWQVAVMVLDNLDVSRYKHRHKKNVEVVFCTKNERAEIELFYDSYRRELKKELEITLRAFVNKNDIFCSAARENSRAAATPEEIKAGRRMREMDTVEIRKRIGASQG